MHVPLQDFNRHLLSNSHKICGNATLLTYIKGVKNPNNNYFSVNYVKYMPLLPRLYCQICEKCRVWLASGTAGCVI